MGFDGIDILRLFAGDVPGFYDDYKALSEDAKTGAFEASKSKKIFSSHEKWNIWLTKCFLSENIDELVRVKRSLQIGMDELVRKRLNNDMINEMFIRWVASIDKTARKIVHRRYPMPPVDSKDHSKALKIKRERDLELEKYLLKSSY